jgi:hypothetical protein
MHWIELNFLIPAVLVTIQFCQKVNMLEKNYLFTDLRFSLGQVCCSRESVTMFE